MSCVACSTIIAQEWRLCLERHSRHYLPFRTMSGSEESLRIWIGDSRSGSAKPRTVRDIVLWPVTDCSGRRGVGRQVYSDPALHAVGMSWQVLSPSWQVSLRDKSGWFQ